VRKYDNQASRNYRDEFLPMLVDPLDRLWGLRVTAAGVQCVPPGCRFRPTGHAPSHDYLWRNGRTLDEYAVVYVTRGRGELETRASGLMPVEAGDALVLLPGVWHRYRHVERSGWDTLWVTFLGPWADRLRRAGVLAPEAPLLCAGLDESILRPFHGLLDHARSQPAGFQQVASADVMGILAALFAAVRRREANDRIAEAVRRAKAAIEAADRPPTVAELPDNAGLGRSRFHHVFKHSAGVSPYQYHLQLRMSRAKELLRGSEMPIKRIAAALRFSSVYQFSRMFRKKTGLSPSRYRRGT